MDGKNPLIIIGGATGVGKTELSVRLAKKLNGQIISADSMQVYKGFDIGTAKITHAEMQGVAHYMIDELSWDESFNIYEFKQRSEKYIQKILSEGSVPIIVGGTGFYIQAVLYDVEFEPEGADKAYRAALEREADEKGAEYMHSRLAAVDPESAAAIHPNNVKRVIRALEYFNETGQKISVHNSEQQKKASPYDFTYFVLNRERSTIYERINRRVDQMIEDGLEEEVKQLLASGVSAGSSPMQGLGYKEMAEHILNGIPIEDTICNIKMNTRHFAKRQITWFKRETDAIWLNYEDHASADEMLEAMIKIIRKEV